MASSRAISRLSTHLPSLSLRSNISKSSLPSKISPLKSTISSSAKRFNQNSRLPVELSCLLSMVPLHSIIASARLTSLLPIQSQNWGLVPQVCPSTLNPWVAMHVYLCLYDYFLFVTRAARRI